MTLSVINLSGIKALWFYEITVPRIDFSLFAITFVIIREITLHKLSGRKLNTLVGEFTFRIKTIIV